MVYVYGEKCLSCKVLHKWAEKCGKYFANDEDIETEVRIWLRQQSQRLTCCLFRYTDKTMRQVYRCWWRIMSKNKCFLHVRISHVLRFVSICDLFTDSLLYANGIQITKMGFISRLNLSLYAVFSSLVLLLLISISGVLWFLGDLLLQTQYVRGQH
jgi:hypothetical protein